jgi:hypothetical protein
MMEAQIVSTTVQQNYYRNRQLRERVPLRNRLRQGVVRTWHKNGKAATEERYQSGLLHGVCRQWNEAGRLLGEFRMEHGTGVQRAWYDNGQLQIEVSTLRGEFCGRNRIWLRDGTLISEQFYLDGRIVSAEGYREAAMKDKTLPRFRGPPARPPLKNRETQKHVYDVFVTTLLENPNQREARAWLQKVAGDQTARSLGRFRSEAESWQFVESLYKSGASGVIVADIYRNERGDQFADSLLVHLPKSAAKRKAVRRACAQLRKRRLGAVEPSEDIGEVHLYLSLA